MDKIIYQKCQRCNRVLKTTFAKERGFGNYCWKLHNIEIQKKRKNLLDSYVPDKTNA